MKKKNLTMLLAAAVGIASLTGCGHKAKNTLHSQKSVNAQNNRSTTSDPIPTKGQPDKEQYLNTFVSSQATTIDPSKGSDLYGNKILYDTTEPLIRIQDKKGGELGEIEYVPAGAKSWDVSEDGLTYTFHLRENKWNDGKAVTAHDYAYGIKRSTDPKTACPYANLMFYIKNGQEVNDGAKKPDELGVKVLDDKTLEITLENPTSYFIDVVTQRTYYPQRKDWIKKYGDAYSTTPETLPQCGPFLLKSWTMNSSQDFIKNPDYWDASNIKLDKIHVAVIQEANTIYQALKSGEIDYAGVSDPKWKAQFFDDENFYHITLANPHTGYFALNCHDSSALKNAKMRQAVSIALDRKELIDATMHGVPIPAYDFVPPAVSSLGLPFNTEGQGCVKDLAQKNPDAKALFIKGLKEAGLDPDPSNFELHYLGAGTSQDARLITEFIQQNLEEVLNIKVKVDQMEWNQFMNAMQAGDYDIAHLAWGADFNDPSNFLEIFYSKSSIQDSGYKNEDFDKFIEEAKLESDPTTRAELLHKAERIVVSEDPAVIPISHSVSHSFIRNYIRNINISSFCTTGYRNIYTSGRK